MILGGERERERETDYMSFSKVAFQVGFDGQFDFIVA